MRLIGDDSTGWDNRGHFFAAAAEAMRRVLGVLSVRLHEIVRVGRYLPL